MKLDELEVGKIYGCRLTRRIVLVIEQDKEVPTKAKNGKPGTKIVKVKIGKWVNKNPDTLEVTYLYQELFDGQLENAELNKDGEWKIIKK